MIIKKIAKKFIKYKDIVVNITNILVIIDDNY